MALFHTTYFASVLSKCYKWKNDILVSAYIKVQYREKCILKNLKKDFSSKAIIVLGNNDFIINERKLFPGDNGKNNAKIELITNESE